MYLDNLDAMNTHYIIVNMVSSYIKYCFSLCISVKMYNICTNIQSLSKLMNIADMVRPYHQMGMYTVHTDSLVVVPPKL